MTEVVDIQRTRSIIKQNFWLQAELLITTPPLELPLAVCAFFLHAVSGSSLIGANSSDSLCQNVHPGECENTILNIIRSNVTVLPEDALDNNFDPCTSLAGILRTPPEECHGAEWNNIFAIRELFWSLKIISSTADGILGAIR